jgi:hypothetical protein
MEEDENVDQRINANDFMNEFAVEEYLTKNRRVRPHSGRFDQEDKFVSEGPSRIGEFGGQPEDDEAYNKGVMFAM